MCARVSGGRAGLKRCGKSCRLRWLNYLRPNIKHGGFSEEEDRIILSLYISIGSRYKFIRSYLHSLFFDQIKYCRMSCSLLGRHMGAVESVI